MKSYSVIISPAAEKVIAKLDTTTQQRIKKYLQDKLIGCDNPRQYGKVLEGDLKNFWRYRVGDYRLIAEIQDDKVIILIVAVDKRNDVYKKKSRRKLK